MKKLFCLCACALALVGPARAETGVVKVDRLNVRAQAKGNAETITQLNRGDRLTILDKKTVPYGARTMTWLKIALPETASVWIKGDFVKDGVVTAERVNLRSGAGINFSIVGMARKGDRVEVRRTLAGWNEIKPLPGCFGWVSGDYVELTPEVQPAPPAETLQPVLPPVQSQAPPAPEPLAPVPPPSPAGVIVVAPPGTAAGSTPTPPTPVVQVVTPETTAPDPSLMAAASPQPVTRQGLLLSCAGFAIKRPGTHALWQEGVAKPHIIAYLKSDSLDLRKYEGTRVQVQGLETTLLNWHNPLVEVQQIVPLR